MPTGNVDEEALRVGLALYQKTTLHGPGFYSLYDLAFDEHSSEPRGLFKWLFAKPDNFWGRQQEIARYLESAGLAQVQRRQVPGSALADFSVRLTPLGKSLYSLAYIQTDHRLGEIAGLKIEDVALLLKKEEHSSELAADIRSLDLSNTDLRLSNYERSMVASYTAMLSIVCEMPERDPKLFWTILERLNNFAGVASLIVTLIALKLSK